MKARGVRDPLDIRECSDDAGANLYLLYSPLFVLVHFLRPSTSFKNVQTIVFSCVRRAFTTENVVLVCAAWQLSPYSANSYPNLVGSTTSRPLPFEYSTLSFTAAFEHYVCRCTTLASST